MADTKQAMLTCKEIINLLSDYIDGHLSPDICEAIEQHMAECHNCYVIVDSLRKTVILYRQLEPPEMPSDVEARLFRVLNLEDYLDS